MCIYGESAGLLLQEFLLARLEGLAQVGDIERYDLVACVVGGVRRVLLR